MVRARRDKMVEFARRAMSDEWRAMSDECGARSEEMRAIGTRNDECRMRRRPVRGWRPTAGGNLKVADSYIVHGI